MNGAIAGIRLTRQPASGSDLRTDRDLIMTVLASGGLILRHWTQVRAPEIPLRFTLHACPDGDGSELDRLVVRALLAAGLVEPGKMTSHINTPRAMHATVHGVSVAVAHVSAIYQTAIDRYGPSAAVLSSRQRQLVHLLHTDPELRLHQYARDGFRLAEYPPPRRFDVEPLINIDFLRTGDECGNPVVWRLARAGRVWAAARQTAL